MKGKIYSVINISGLTAGITAAILIGLWIRDELLCDHYHQHHRRLAQVMDTRTFHGQTSTSGDIAIRLADELRTRYGSDDGVNYITLRMKAGIPVR